MRQIDADALIKEYCDGCEFSREGVCDCEPCGKVCWVSEAPTIDPESVRPQGEWIGYHEADLGWDEWGCRCSNCKWEVENEKITFPMNFCPNCGAKMKGAGD